MAKALTVAFVSLVLWLVSSAAVQAQTPDNQRIIVGAERLDVLLPMLKGKNVALVVNHSSLVGNTHLVDTLNQHEVCIAQIFAPEHGFRGDADAGEHVKDGYDPRTGIPIISLYGKHRKPLPEDLEGVSVVIFDIQDVGARFYTYISTLFYVMEACAEQGKSVIILDRPNPNGHYVDGPVLDYRLNSFIGIAPIPIVHGCTVGELARLFVGEYWIYRPKPLNYEVIPCLNYTHSSPYELPVAPSPNLKTTRAILLYPSLCLFEGTTCSIGRGTDWPFEVVGHPDFSCDSFNFVPRPNPGNKNPLHEGWLCGGWDFTKIPVDTLRASKQLNLSWLLGFYNQFPDKTAFFREDRFFDLLAGTRNLQQQIMEGKTEAEIRASWAEDLKAFRVQRQKCLIYTD
jgi:uncharacterized protein YbbC (DUF1343 family)